VIPKVIHQIWLGPLLPPLAAMESWKEKHPDWDYRLWTEDNLPCLKNAQPFLESSNFPQKADILRYEILEQFGGVYIDADVYCVKSIDPLLDDVNNRSCSLVAAYEGRVEAKTLVANTVMMAEPGNPFIRLLVDSINIEQEGQAWEITGPQYFTDMIETHQPKICLLPHKTFFPIHHRDKENRQISISSFDSDPEVYGVHLWAGTKRGYCPVWYKQPWDYLVYQVRKALNKTFELKI